MFDLVKAIAHTRGYPEVRGQIEYLFYLLSQMSHLKHFSMVTFKAQMKVGWQPKYYIKCYIP